jgi:hypothetical protein
MVMAARKEERSAYWSPHVERWKSSGVSAKRFCQDNELPYWQFLYWSKELRQQERGAAPSAFTRVVPVADTAASQGLHVTLPNGVRIGGIDAGNVGLAAELLAQL